jgi:OOP family OmpA-OmpF porin
MKNNVVETVKFCFTDSVIAQLGEVLGEDTKAVQKGLAQAVPLVLDSVLRQAEQEGNPGALLLLARKTDMASDSLSQVGMADASWYQQGGIILVELLGSSYGATMAFLAQESRLRPASAERLLQATATAVLGVLGKFAAEKALLPSEFVRWLTLQKDRISAAVLPVVRMAPAAMPAASSPSAVIMPARQPVAPMPQAFPPASTQPAEASRWRGGVLQWGILLLLAMSLGYFFGRDRLAGPAAGPSAAPADAAATSGSTEPTEPVGRYNQNRDTYIYDTGQPIVLTLADGSTQKVGANSTESRLYAFLASPSVQVDSVNRTKGWINFDRVYFEPTKATLTPESARQLTNVASILKTFPKAVVKIGGYTDSSGVAVHNFQLSEERAKTAMFALISLGISADNLQYKGYGPKHFLMSNNTPAGRAINRRISIRVIKK